MYVKRIEQKDNPLYPLPADYNELTVEGKRQARVNAARQWTIPNQTPEQKGDSFLASLKFFDYYYLWPDESAGFNPMFYDIQPIPLGGGHDALVRQSGRSWLGIGVCPRGFSKSVNIRKEIVMCMPTAPGWSCIYCTSTDDNMQMTGDIVKLQFADNDRIINDFSPEMPDGKLRLPRGEAPFSTSHLRLSNGARFQGRSARSRMRGGRPTVFYLDDPEYDPSASTSMEIIRKYMDDLLFRQALPMVMRGGSRIIWRATFISKGHYAYHAMQVNEQGHSSDPRFNLWDRVFIDVEGEGPKGERVSSWPDMWPATEKERLERAKSNPAFLERKSLEMIEQTLGRSAYLAEYRGMPGEGDDKYFPHLSKETHGWWLEDVDDLYASNPWESKAIFGWMEEVQGVWTKRTMPIQTFLRQSRLFMTGDTSHTSGRDSDRKCCTVMAVPKGTNCLFILDQWAQRCREELLVRNIFRLADKWKVPAIHVEAIRQGMSLLQSLEHWVSTRAKEMVGVEHLPSVRKVKRGMAEKSELIASLLFRFEHGMIKLPWDKQNDKYMKLLFGQIEDFNPDAPSGGLQNDDNIDTVAMAHLVLKGRMSRAPRISDDDSRTVIQMALDGEEKDRWGNPLLMGVNIQEMTIDEVGQLLDRRVKEDRERKFII